MKILSGILQVMLTAVPLLAAPAGSVEIFSAKDLQADAAALKPNGPVSAVKDLTKYGNHYFLLAKRIETGSSELHDHEADIFVVESGDGALLSGGKITGAKTIKPGEIRGTGIEGGERHPLHAGDVVHIPAGVAHQVVVSKGKPFVYFVVKVTGQ